MRRAATLGGKMTWLAVGFTARPLKVPVAVYTILFG